MARIQLVADHGKSFSAWTKAPADIAAIADRFGFLRLPIGRFRLGNFSLIRRVLRKLRLERQADRISWKVEFFCLRRKFRKCGGDLLLQHPLPYAITFDMRNLEDFRSLSKVGVRIIVVVHDIAALRGKSKDVGGDVDTLLESATFHVADWLIVHNMKMQDYMISQGLHNEKMISLEMFDYLLDTGRHINVSRTLQNRVMLAGNLGSGKAGYVKQLWKISGVDWLVYGSNFNPEIIHGSNIMYRGKFNPDQPPVNCDASFGLVWDGDSIETCAGPTGEYLKVNNPHKLSLYLSMGLPVIVWKESAVAEFVLRNNIGIVVGSLRDTAHGIARLSTVSYLEMQRHACEVGMKMRRGLFFEKALSCVLGGK